MERSKEFIITEKFAFHLLRHLTSTSKPYKASLMESGVTDEQIKSSLSTPGSKFSSDIISAPEDLFELIKKNKNCESRNISNGYASINFEFDFVIGNEGIANLEQLSPEVLKTMTQEDRNGVIVNVVRMLNLTSTNKMEIIVNPLNEIITAFPGRFAPPLPYPHFRSRDRVKYSDFWKQHVFIEHIRQ